MLNLKNLFQIAGKTKKIERIVCGYNLYRTLLLSKWYSA